ncbi:TetR/AcrR family transcriptional regulator, partial [Bacteroidota bacterium]
EELFTRFGMKRITVEEICEKAKVSKMTFYKYFPNKNELIKFWWTEIIDEGYRRFDEVNAQDIPFTEKVKFILKLKKEYADKLSKEFMEEYFALLPDMRVTFAEAFQRSIETFMKFIKDAQKKGDVRKDMRPEFFLAVVNKLLELPQDPAVMKLYPNYTDLVLEINKFMFYGIMARRENE